MDTPPIQQHDRYTWTAPEGAREMPGFSADGVTYESHTFWLVREGTGGRRGATLYVRHGGGVESLSVRHLARKPIEALLDAGAEKEAFFLTWTLFEVARESRLGGASEATRRLKRAFVEGHLKKRKMPGRDAYKVWVENPDGQETQLGSVIR